MSLLHQEDRDDAAKGEELTKGTSHVVLATVIAAVVVTIAIAVYVIAGQKPAMAIGDVLSVVAHPQHTESSGFDANGSPMIKDDFDQMLVFTRVRLHNQSTSPLFVEKIQVDVTLADGVHTAYARSPGEYDQVFLAYPGIPVQHDSAMPLTPTLDPGQTIEGTFVANFGVSKAEWDARTGLNYTVSFRYQPSLVLTPKVAITEQ